MMAWLLVGILGSGLLLWGRLRLKVPREAVAVPKPHQLTESSPAHPALQGLSTLKSQLKSSHTTD
ncbi:MAG: hypothetical protein CMJ20_00090 [Phycisphaeraceae bacterium]|nr:hypothetical protein [Phycisphaeraceae bacterium]